MSSDYGSMPPSNDAGGGYGQPPAGYGDQGGSGGSPPPNYLVWAIVTTVLCCLPLGVVSIVYAAQVNGKWSSGDHQGAQESSQKAKQWAIWSAIAGLIVAVLYVIFIVVVGVSMDGSTTDT